MTDPRTIPGFGGDVFDAIAAEVRTREAVLLGVRLLNDAYRRKTTTLCGPGQPARRYYAVAVGISESHVSRAYAELERAGIIVNGDQIGRGRAARRPLTFVTEGLANPPGAGGITDDETPEAIPPEPGGLDPANHPSNTPSNTPGSGVRSSLSPSTTQKQNRRRANANGAGDDHGRLNGLRSNHLLERVVAAAVDGDAGTPHTIRAIAKGLPDNDLAIVLESLQHCDPPPNSASAYIVQTLKNRRAERFPQPQPEPDF